MAPSPTVAVAVAVAIAARPPPYPPLPPSARPDGHPQNKQKNCFYNTNKKKVIVMASEMPAKARRRTIALAAGGGSRGKGAVVVTTYGMVSSNPEQFAPAVGAAGTWIERGQSRQHVWDYVVLDEGHKIKNASTKWGFCFFFCCFLLFRFDLLSTLLRCRGLKSVVFPAFIQPLFLCCGGAFNCCAKGGFVS